MAAVAAAGAAPAHDVKRIEGKADAPMAAAALAAGADPNATGAITMSTSQLHTLIQSAAADAANRVADEMKDRHKKTDSIMSAVMKGQTDTMRISEQTKLSLALAQALSLIATRLKTSDVNEMHSALSDFFRESQDSTGVEDALQELRRRCKSIVAASDEGGGGEEDTKISSLIADLMRAAKKVHSASANESKRGRSYQSAAGAAAAVLTEPAKRTPCAHCGMTNHFSKNCKDAPKRRASRSRSRSRERRRSRSRTPPRRSSGIGAFKKCRYCLDVMGTTRTNHHEDDCRFNKKKCTYRRVRRRRSLSPTKTCTQAPPKPLGTGVVHSRNTRTTQSAETLLLPSCAAACALAVACRADSPPREAERSGANHHTGRGNGIGNDDGNTQSNTTAPKSGPLTPEQFIHAAPIVPLSRRVKDGREFKLQNAILPLRALADSKKAALRNGSRFELCSFCKKRGHIRTHCPSTLTECPASFSITQREWTTKLIASPQVVIEKEFAGLSMTQARHRITEIAQTYNTGNPWKPSHGGAVNTRDRLRSEAGYWKAIGTDATVMSWILHGARLPLVAKPLPLAFRNHPSYNEHVKFVDSEIATAIAEGTFVKIASSDARMVNPISVEPNKAGTKLRMCIDARWHNAHLPKINFKLESIEANLSQVVNPLDVMLTTDISRAYYSVPIVEDASPYLVIEHRGELYAPTVLPFGSSLAPFIFNRITKQVVKLVRFIGVQVINFYDDFLWAAPTEKGAELAVFVAWLLPASGWALNDKCRWTPARVQEFLGFEINLESYSVHVTEQRMVRAQTLIDETLRARAVDTHQLERLVGQLASMRPAIPIAGLWTRNLYRHIASAKEDVTEAEHVPREAMEELKFWKSNLRTRNGQKIVAQAAYIEWRVDTSETAVGAVSSDGRSITIPLPANMIGRSSTARELFGVKEVVVKWAPLYAGRSVRLYLDSFAATRNLAKGGGPIPALTELTKEVWKAADELKMSIRPDWIPREENTHADKLSKLFERWFKLAPEYEETARTLSEQYAASTGGVAPLSNVPFNLIGNEINKAKAASAALCIIHPIWPAQSWWPILYKHIRTSCELGTADRVLQSNYNDADRISFPHWRMQALIVDFGC